MLPMVWQKAGTFFHFNSFKAMRVPVRSTSMLRSLIGVRGDRDVWQKIFTQMFDPPPTIENENGVHR
ncbi:MAG: hypothetical protein H6595_14585 [Flavobacteriales bacterium]|nr:hypothetical protein [Flavobacteriales bacterium]